MIGCQIGSRFEPVLLSGSQSFFSFGLLDLPGRNIFRASRKSTFGLTGRGSVGSHREAANKQARIGACLLATSVPKPSRSFCIGLTFSFQGKKYKPTDLRPKKTRALRRRLNKHQESLKTSKQQNKERLYKQRKFALKA